MAGVVDQKDPKMWGLSYVVRAAAWRAAGDAADEAVAEHRLPGRRPADRLQGHGRPRPRKLTVSCIVD